VLSGWPAFVISLGALYIAQVMASWLKSHHRP
jgi:hypothetical protein